MKRVRLWVHSLREKVWFYPVMYSLLGLLFAAFCISYDMNVLPWLGGIIPKVFLTSLEISKIILSMVGAAFITITIFTFSTTMVVLTMYTAQYSPRVVKNFLGHRETMQSFGVFVSGFIYVVVVLLFMSNYTQDQRMVSATVSILYILVGLVYFFRFINSVSTYIQAGNLIERLKENAVRAIEDYRQRVSAAEHVLQVSAGKRPVHYCTSDQDGYIQDVNDAVLKKTAASLNLSICLDKVPGQFVTRRTVIGSFWACGEQLTEAQQEEVQEQIRDSMIVGEERLEISDFDFTIQKIVEVALKALSPGITDPNTAIQCIRSLSLLLRKLSDLPKGYYVYAGKVPERENVQRGRVCIEAVDFEILLMNTYQPLLNYGKGDIMVLREMIKSLYVAAETASLDNRVVIIRFTEYLGRIIAAEAFDLEEEELLQKEIREVLNLTRFSSV